MGPRSSRVGRIRLGLGRALKGDFYLGKANGSPFARLMERHS